jgi:hypothetical protein
MVLEFSIVGGRMKVHKTAFIQEMLGKESLLKVLMNSTTGRHPGVCEPDADNFITVDFSGSLPVSIGDEPSDILKKLKAKYRGKIKGKLICKGTLFTFEIDLNSDDDKIEFIME